MTIDEVPHTIIGVTPPEFFGLQVGRRVDLTVPIDGSDEPTLLEIEGARSSVSHRACRREAAVADLNVAFQQYLAGDKTLSERARAQAFKSLDLAPSSSGLPEFRDRYGKPVQAMLAIVGVLLVLGCANLASLFLARAAARQRDLSVCLALGASRTPPGAPGSLGNALHLDGRRSARRARRLLGRRCAGRVPAGVRCADRLADSS